MLGSVVLKEDFIPPKSGEGLRLVIMPEANYIGDLYETPKKRNQQEKAQAELYRVRGLGGDDGVYAVPVRRSGSPPVDEAFLDQSKKVVGKLPKRKSPLPIYGLNEVTLEPENGVLDIPEGQELHLTLVEGIRKNHTLYELKI